jgi:hypothetical protein
MRGIYTLLAFAMTAGLAGCATPEERRATQSAWSECIMRAAGSLDDGKTDALTIAMGIIPQCHGGYLEMTNQQVGTMITEGGQANMRMEMRDGELKLATAAVLFRRKNLPGAR